MRQADPNIETLELVLNELRPLLSEFVLVGGCAVGLLVTDSARPQVRHTIDVDLLTQVAPISNYYKLCERLREIGFQEGGDIVCRWRKGGLVIDVMPTDEAVLGFTNSWYKVAVETAVTSVMPSGIAIRHISAPLFIATKIESFYGRGNGDYLHHDIEDILNVVDGRSELVDEVLSAPQAVQSFIREEIDDLLADRLFTDSLRMHLRPEQSEQARLPLVTERLRRLAGL